MLYAHFLNRAKGGQVNQKTSDRGGGLIDHLHFNGGLDAPLVRKYIHLRIHRGNGRNGVICELDKGFS